MKSVHRVRFFILFLFALAGFSLNNSTTDTVISTPDSVAIQSGGVSVTIPEWNYIPRTIKREIDYQVSNFTWSATEYDNYTYKTFSGIPRANSRIDFENIDYSLLHAAIFYETNRHRAFHGKKAFTHSPALEKAAKGHSDDMVEKNFFDHTSPVKGKETMTKRLALVGITEGYRGENIAYSFGIEYKAGKSVYTPDQNDGYFSYTFKGEPIENHTYLGFAKEVLAQWMSSPGHRANILDSHFTYLGTGASHYKNNGFYGMDNFKCTQNFGSMKGPPVEDPNMDLTGMEMEGNPLFLENTFFFTFRNSFIILKLEIT